MIRKFKALGLAFIAVLAMGAFAASAAQATGPQWHLASETGTYNQTVSGTGTNIGEHFLTEAGKVECEVSHYSGTLTGVSTTIDVTPTYTNCTALNGFSSATIHHNGCKYRFHATTHDSAISTYTANVSVVCEGTNKITITAGTCEAKVGNQTVGKVDITNMTVAGASNDDITIRPTVTGITYEVTKDGFLCPFNGTGVKHGGEYTSEGYITGTAPGGLIATTT